MSSKELLLTYVRYNLWANNALAELLKTLDQSWLDKEIKSSFSSVRKTAFHIWDGEYVWLSRFKGISPTDFPSKNFSSETHPSRFVEGAKDFLNFIEQQNNSFFSNSTTFKDMAGKEHRMENSGMLFHVMNHSSFHRGQIVMMLRNLGFEGEMPRTDMIVYLREKG